MTYENSLSLNFQNSNILVFLCVNVHQCTFQILTLTWYFPYETWSWFYVQVTYCVVETLLVFLLWVRPQRVFELTHKTSTSYVPTIRGQEKAFKEDPGRRRYILRRSFCPKAPSLWTLTDLKEEKNDLLIRCFRQTLLSSVKSRPVRKLCTVPSLQNSDKLRIRT